MPLAQGLLRVRGTCKVQSLIEKSLSNAEDLDPCMNIDCLLLRIVGCRHGVLGKLVVPTEGPETKRRKTSAGEGGQQDHSACCLLSAPLFAQLRPLRGCSQMGGKTLLPSLAAEQWDLCISSAALSATVRVSFAVLGNT